MLVSAFGQPFSVEIQVDARHLAAEMADILPASLEKISTMSVIQNIYQNIQYLCIIVFPCLENTEKSNFQTKLILTSDVLAFIELAKTRTDNSS